MNNERKILSLVILSIGLIIGCIGCRSSTGNQQPQPLTITCHVFYRDSQAVPPGPESTLTLAQHGDRQVAEFDALEFSAFYQDDPFEGRSLAIAVTAASSDQQVVRHLYQMDRQQSIRNQFTGGHGFTGLAYVYHPTTAAELQYFCDAKSSSS